MAATESSRTRDFPFTCTRAANSNDGQTFEGYAAVFNSPTHIRDDDGEYDEVIRPGAFKRTLSRSTPIFMFDHGQHPLIGTMPLGRIETANEDDRGVFVRARMTDNWLISPVRDAIRDGAITGMSFRYAPVKQQWSGKPSPLCRYGEMRAVHEVRCPELGPVVSPAYKDTTAAVRSALRGLEATLPGLMRVELLDRDQDGLVINDDTNDPKELVEDAVEALWGLNDFQSDVYTVDFFDDRAVFYVLGAANSEYQGLWSVDYSYADGQVTIGTPARVKAQGYIPVGAAAPTDLAQWDPNLNSAALDGTTRDEPVPEPQSTGPSEELAVTGPSDEPATTADVPSGRSTHASRQRELRLVQLDIRGIPRPKEQ